MHDSFLTARIAQLRHHPLHDAAALQDLTKNHRTRMRIPEDPPTHSDNMRPLIPGYSPTCDALP